MASSTTPTRHLLAEWTLSGGCTSGSIVRREGATRRACGGAATTSTTSGEGLRSEGSLLMRQLIGRPDARQLLQHEYPVKHRLVAHPSVAATMHASDIRSPLKGGDQCLVFDLSPLLSHSLSREHQSPPSPRRHRLLLPRRYPGTQAR